jgi:DNA-binding MarR family transcriptional regulator
MKSHPAVPVDAYVFDVLLRDLVGHDKQPAAFLVYLHLHGLAARQRWRPVEASLRDVADLTGLSKSAVQTAMNTLRRRELIESGRDHITATSRHQVLRPWMKRKTPD